MIIFSKKGFSNALILLLAVSLFIAGCIEGGKPDVSTLQGLTQTGEQQTQLLSFKTWNEVSEFLQATQSGYGISKTHGIPVAAVRSDALESGTPSKAAGDFSSTNVQVEGVDEADTVKNDGEFIYVISENKVKILKAYPASEMKIVSEISFGENAYPSQIFVYGDKLVVFGSENAFWVPMPLPIVPTPLPVQDERMIAPDYPYQYPYYQQASFVKVYDTASKENPVLVKSFSSSGTYVQSRLIDGRVFVVFSENAYYWGPIPTFAEDEVLKETTPVEVNYFDYPDQNYNFVTILGFNLNDFNEKEARRVVLMGYAQTLFVSKENMFITQSVFDYTSYPTLKWIDYSSIIRPYATSDFNDKIAAIDASDASEWRKDALKTAQAQKLIESLSESAKEEVYEKIDAATENKQDELARIGKPAYAYGQAKTVIHKFSLGEETIAYLGKGKVVGSILNQFSMDEYNGYFRIATTTEPAPAVWDEVLAVGAREIVGGEQQKQLKERNHVFVLNEKMETVGKLTDLAPGERIYSARFMGERLYLVTFKKVDPLFAIDLSNPTNPRVLGQLKIPGYSDYLHPFDEKHIIGFGKSAVPAKQGQSGDGDFAWYQGLKLSLFDVSDVNAIKEVAKFEIGDRGSESYALQEHKAFLFAKNKNGLLVIPVLEARINPVKYPQGIEPHSYGDYVFQGAYVLNLDAVNGFVLKGRISHADQAAFEKAGYYYWGNTDVQRSAYIENVLYTISNRFVKANDLTTLEALASVEIAAEQPYPYVEEIAVEDSGN